MKRSSGWLKEQSKPPTTCVHWVLFERPSDELTDRQHEGGKQT